MAAEVSPTASSLRSPPDAPAAPESALAAQLQGLYQLHVQLETVIAFLEGREPHLVPYFESEGSPGPAPGSLQHGLAGLWAIATMHLWR